MLSIRIRKPSRISLAELYLPQRYDSFHSEEGSSPRELTAAKKGTWSSQVHLMPRKSGAYLPVPESATILNSFREMPILHSQMGRKKNLYICVYIYKSIKQTKRHNTPSHSISPFSSTSSRGNSSHFPACYVL